MLHNSGGGPANFLCSPRTRTLAHTHAKDADDGGRRPRESEEKTNYRGGRAAKVFLLQSASFQPAAAATAAVEINMWNIYTQREWRKRYGKNNKKQAPGGGMGAHTLLAPCVCCRWNSIHVEKGIKFCSHEGSGVVQVWLNVCVCCPPRSVLYTPSLPAPATRPAAPSLICLLH